MTYQQDVNGLWSIDRAKTRLSSEEKEKYCLKAQDACQHIRRDFLSGGHAYLRFERAEDQRALYDPLIARYKAHYTDVVILGTGGSSLGGQALAALKGYGRSLACLTPRLHFLDNIDPASWSQPMRALEPEKTGFIVISKSGTTTETLCQFLAALKRWEDVLGKSHLPQHFAIVTEDKPSPLFQLGDHYGLPFFEHPALIGGRFSVFSIVGVLPALLAGVNLNAFYRGANNIRTRFLNADQLPDPALGAALMVGLGQEKGITATVMMPYADKLALFSSWFRQLWSESLGKQGYGLTPLRSLGTVDQHSQLQLYLDGPADKVYTFFCKMNEGQGPMLNVEESSYGKSLAYLNSHYMGDVFDAMQQATIETLKSKGLPVRVFRLRDDSEETLGALMMHFMLETVVAAQLIEVNAFDQPAVEESKQLTQRLLLSLTEKKAIQ